MVQESTNTFSDGLVKDLNPLTTPNTVLTDALNATLLTYNGNELVLQNDLGNTKIIGAKLPEGYIPLGIKEYGGILYIISSNGENVEIGSFPSPEMINASLDETNPLLLGIFIDEDNYEINKNIKLSNSPFKPGENFLIILDTIQGGEHNSTGNNFISDYITRKVYKPKLISIANGIELDITDSLIKQQNINNNPDYYSWFIDGSPSESDINLFKTEKITQIYKSRKSGEIYLRFDLESIDKFYLNNTINNTSAYPVISKDNEDNYHLTFSFYLEHGSYIKCNEISLKYTLTDLITGINTSNTLIVKLAYPFINGLTYDENSIIYNNGIYYKALSLNNNQPLSNTVVWQNLGEYDIASQALLPELILKEYSINNQYNNIFDINLEGNRNKLINYEITPTNSLFDLSFNKFTIVDNLDLSKDNISWILSPYWEKFDAYWECEEDVLNPGFSTGYKLFNLIGRFGKDSSGNTISLDRNDLPLENNNKQAVIVRENSIENYEDYDIISTFYLNNEFTPVFDPSLFIVLSGDTEFRKESNSCLQGFEMTISHDSDILDDDFIGEYSWPTYMSGDKLPTQIMKDSAKLDSLLNVSIKITSQYPISGDFGNITFSTFLRRVVEWWDWDDINLQWNKRVGDPELLEENLLFTSILNNLNTTQTINYNTSSDKFIEDDYNKIGIIKLNSVIYTYVLSNPEIFITGNPVVNGVEHIENQEPELPLP